MYDRGRQKAIWIANSSLIPQLLQLSVAVGTGGTVVPVLSQSGGQFNADAALLFL